MASKIVDLLTRLGAQPGKDNETWTLPGAALGIAGLDDRVLIQAFSDESIGFSAPRALTALGPIWVKDVADESGLLQTVRDAHRRLEGLLDGVARDLGELGTKTSTADGLVTGTMTVAGYKIELEADKTGTLRLCTVGGRSVTPKEQRLDKSVTEYDEDTLHEAVRLVAVQMKESGLLEGRGVFEASTARADVQIPTGEQSAMPSPLSDVKKSAPRPRRRASRARQKADWDSLSGSAEPVVESDEKDALPTPAAPDELKSPPSTDLSLEGENADADNGMATQQAPDSPGAGPDAETVQGSPQPAPGPDKQASNEARAADDGAADAGAADDGAADAGAADARADWEGADDEGAGDEGADEKPDAVAAEPDDEDGDKSQPVDGLVAAEEPEDDKPGDPKADEPAPFEADRAQEADRPEPSPAEDAPPQVGAGDAIAEGAGEAVSDEGVVPPDADEPPAQADATDATDAHAAPDAPDQPEEADADAAPPAPFVEDEEDATRTVAAFTPPKEALPSAQQSSSSEESSEESSSASSSDEQPVAASEAQAPEPASAQDAPGDEPTPRRPHRAPGVAGNRPLPQAVSAEASAAPMPEHTVLTPLPQLSSLRASMTGSGTEQGEPLSMSFSMEDSEEELARAMEEMSSEEDSLEVDEGSEDSGAFDSDERPTEVAPPPSAAPVGAVTDERAVLGAPQDSGSKKMPPPPPASSVEGSPLDELTPEPPLSMAEAWEASTEHRPLDGPDPVPTASMPDDGPLSVDSALVEPIVSSDAPGSDHPPIEAVSADGDKADSITDKTAMGAPESSDAGFDGDDSQTAVPGVTAPPPSALSLPSELPEGLHASDPGTGEVRRTSSAESTFQKLSDVVGSGISTGKTGAIELDAEAFAYLRGGGTAATDLATLVDEERQLTERLALVRERIAEIRADQELAARAKADERPTRRLAESMKRLRSERGDPEAPAPDAFSDGVALEDVRRALAADDGKTQMVEGGFAFAGVSDDDGGVFDSPSEVQASGKVALVVQSQKALERLARELQGRVDDVVPVSAIDDLAAVHARETFRAVVFVRPRVDSRLTRCLDEVRPGGAGPKVLILSPTKSLDDNELVDLRLDLPKKTGDVAQTVVDGLASLTA